MSVEALTLSLVVLTFAIYLYIGWRSKVKDTSNFFVAGNDIPAVANGAAIAADWMSAASFISMAGLISFLGYDGTIYLMGWTGGYVLLALLLAPYLRKFGRYTVLILSVIVITQTVLVLLLLLPRFSSLLHT